MAEHGWPERLLPGPVAGHSAFTGLSRTIVGQQLSWQVARVIFARVQDAACAVSPVALLVQQRCKQEQRSSHMYRCGLTRAPRLHDRLLPRSGRCGGPALVPACST